MQMQERRQKILAAGLQLLLEEGLAGFTQPRVAARAGLRQGNLTYYFPTRTDLLVAVARIAMDRQIASVTEMVTATTSVPKAIEALTTVITRHDNTRLLVALNQSADYEPELRALFNDLTDRFVEQLAALLDRLKLEPSRARVDMLHAAIVGLSVIELATSRPNGKARAKAALSALFAQLAASTRP